MVSTLDFLIITTVTRMGKSIQESMAISSPAIYSGTKYCDTHMEFHSLFLDVSSTDVKLELISTISKVELNYRLKFSLAYKDIHEKNTLFY